MSKRDRDDDDDDDGTELGGMSVDAPPPTDDGDTGVLIDVANEEDQHHQPEDDHHHHQKEDVEHHHDEGMDDDRNEDDGSGMLSTAVEVLSGGGGVSNDHVSHQEPGNSPHATYASSLSVPSPGGGIPSKMVIPMGQIMHWSQEEDALLMKLAMDNGAETGELINDKVSRSWTVISKHFPGRTPIQCRDHYFSTLDPNLKRPWSEEEERKLVASQMKIPGRFTDISKYFHQRSDIALEMHWNEILQSRHDDVARHVTDQDIMLFQNIEFDAPSTHTGERRPWTPEEDHFLLQAVKEHGNANWTVIARMLKGRQPKQCRQRYFNKVDPALSTKAWTDEEDKRIVAAQNRLGNRFAEISRYLDGRSESLVSHRWHFVLSRRAQDILNEMTEADCAFLAEIPEMPKKERRQRSTWTPDEDQKLLQLVTDLGQGNWPNIAYHLPGRQPKQCRDRFVNKLDPNLKKGGWTGEEDKMIVAAHMRLGNRWHEMAKAIAGRSELQIKDRWYAVVQPKADMIAKDLTDADFHFLEVAQPPNRWRKIVTTYPSPDHTHENFAPQSPTPKSPGTMMMGGIKGAMYDPSPIPGLVVDRSYKDAEIIVPGGANDDSVMKDKDVSGMDVGVPGVGVVVPQHEPHMGTERRTWTEDEDAQLLKLVHEYGQGNWTLVAKQLHGRLPKQCRQRFLNKVDPTVRKGQWTDDEDKRIVAAQSRIGSRFAEIAKFLEGRSETLVNHRWHKVLRSKAEQMLSEMTSADFDFLNGVKIKESRRNTMMGNPGGMLGGLKDDGTPILPTQPRIDEPRLRAWTDDEDKKLLELVEQFGQGAWQQVSKHLEGRLPKQCRDRFVNKIDPNLKKTEWTEEEDKLVVAAQSRLGERWAAIGRFLDGRSEAAIKTRWYSALKPRAHKIMETLSNDDFEFLNQAPPSQRWRKDVRAYKRPRTMVAEQVLHLNHMDGQMGGDYGSQGGQLMDNGYGQPLQGVVMGHQPISASAVNPQ